MFKKTGIMVILLKLFFIGKTQRNIELNLVFGQIGSVSALSLTLPKLHGRKRIVADKFLYIIDYTVFVAVFVFIKALFADLIAKNEFYSRIYNRLP